MSLIKRYTIRMILSVLTLSSYGVGSHAMESVGKTELSLFFAHEESVLVSLPCNAKIICAFLSTKKEFIKKIKLNEFVHEPFLTGLYVSLLPWISNGTIFIYSGLKFEKDECKWLVARSRIVAILSEARDEWLSKTPGKILPDVETHLLNLEEKKDFWDQDFELCTDEFGDKESSGSSKKEDIATVGVNFSRHSIGAGFDE